VTSAHSGPKPPKYEIYVRGHLGETPRFAFPALQTQARGEDTLLTGTLLDQAALVACSPRSRPSGSNCSKSAVCRRAGARPPRPEPGHD
jgi:hypothetical protein